MSTSSSSSSTRNKKRPARWFLGGLPFLVLLMLPIYRTIFFATDPLSYILPNLMLFTPYREATRAMWKKTLKFPHETTCYPAHVPTIEAKDYSYEALKRATENFRFPAIVRGLFKDAPASTLWPTMDHLPSKLSGHKIPVVQNAVLNTQQNDRVLMPFSDAFQDIVSNDQSKMYLFFPVQSRFNFNHSDVGSKEDLAEKVNRIVREDLEIDKRIWNGFGTKRHSTFYGSQLIIGRGANDSMTTTGTGWHCAAGNNWFVQVVGSKRWYFMDPKYSAYMHPLRGGLVNMQAGTPMGQLQKHIPLRYADVNAGDLLYNPDWEWHTIQNYEGLSIGVPIREVNISLSMNNNMLYSTLVVINKVLQVFNLDIGGYPDSK